MPEVNKSEIFVRLSHFVNPDDSSELPESILGFIIQQVLIGEAGSNSEEIKKRIKDEFDLEFEKQEVEKATKILLSKNLIVQSGKKLHLTDKIRREFTKEIKESEESESKFYKELREKFFEFDPALNPDEIDILQQDFSEYLNHIFVKLGAESVYFLYPNDKNLIKTIQSCNNERLFRVLRRRDRKLETFRKNKFSITLKSFSDEQKQHLANKLNATFLYTLVSIDPKCSQYLQKAIKGYELYLDTNFIYHLLGLDGISLVNSSKKLLNIAKQFNFNLFVTPRTLEEFNASLSNAENFLRRYTIPSDNPELLKTGADVLEEAFIRTYWEKYADEKMRLEEFLSFYKNVKSILEGMGVKISDNLVETIKKDKEKLTETAEVLQRFAPLKNNAVAEHDAFHILLVQKTREIGFQSGTSGIKHWFLTNDRSLLRYELSLERRKKTYYPVSILPEHLLQILRPLLPRSLDFEKSLINFVVGHHQSGFESLSPNLAFDILKRIDRYKSTPKEIAIKILTDTHFAYKLKGIKDKEKRKAEIDSQLLKNAKQAIEEKGVLLKQSRQLGNIRYQLERENDELKKFKKEIEKKRLRLGRKIRWAFFIFIKLSSFALLVFGTYKTITFLNLQGVFGLMIVIIALVIWLVILLISLRILPDYEAKGISEDIKFAFSIGQKLTSNFFKKEGKE